MTQEDDPAPHGLAADLPHLARRRFVLAGLGMGGAALSLLAVRGGAETVTASAPDGTVCVAVPAGTPGPFPADGTNVRDGQTVNILTDSGVIREDIRASIGGLEPVATGVPLALEITLVEVRRSCAPLAGLALYAWQCDAEAVYSIYGAPDRNYLRGVGISDAQGRVRLTTIVPGCYPGRWPHIHFEVFAGADQAVTGEAALLTSQFALPEGPCRAVYDSQSLYAASRQAIDGVSLRRDGVFRGSSSVELAAQTLVMEGDPDTGYRATVQVGLLV